MPADVIAATRIVYSVPLTSPDSDVEVAADPVFATLTTHDVPPFVEVSTRYPVTGNPPASAGTSQPRTTSPDETVVTARAVGAVEVVRGVADTDAPVPSPEAVNGVTRRRYERPLVNVVAVAVRVTGDQETPPSLELSTR
jgi:hypothetical protein